MVMEAVITINGETSIVTILKGREGIQAALSLCKTISVTTPEGLFELWVDRGSILGKKIGKLPQLG